MNKINIRLSDHRFFRHCLSCFALLGLFGWGSASAQVSGSVFRDYNGNGMKDNTATYNEPFLAGVIVTAYNAAGAAVGTTTTDATGPYTIPAVSGALRIEFTLPAGNACVGGAVDYSSSSGSTYGSSVQFVTGGSTDVDFAVNNPADYNTGAANTSAFIPCYVNGDPLPSGSPSGAEAWFVGFPYNTTGTPTTAPPAQMVGGAVLGSTWGTAYSKQAQKIFVSAFIKRHVGLGTLGSGGIYLLEPTAGSFNVMEFYDMDDNGYRTRASAAAAIADPYGEGSSFAIAADNATITYLGSSVDPLTGALTGLGVVGTNVDRGLSTDPTDPGHDPAAFDQTGKVGLGDIDISDDGQYLFVMNLYSRKVFRLKLDDPFNPTSVTDVESYDVPDPGCTNGTYRPFGLKFYRDKVYVGVVCSAENGGTNANLSAFVYELNDPTAVAASFNATAVITILNMTYDRQSSSDWRPWTNDSDPGVASPIRFSQPILSDIDVNERGDIIMAFMDRAGNQWGYNNYKFLKSDPATIQNHAAGEILIAGVDCSTGGFMVENNGQFTSSGVSFASNHTSLLFGMQGIGGREFFDDFSPAGDPHAETTQGALALLKGTGEVMTSAFAIFPVLASDGGVSRYSTSDGTFVSGYALYGGNSGNFFGKASGFGDLDLSGAPSPIEIGNRVWMDTDNDGIQDADEMGIANVTIKLYAANGTTLLGTTMTDGSGNWYFNNANVTDGNTALVGDQAGPQPNTAYVIRVDAANFPSGKSLSTFQNVGGIGQPDVRDNDAALNGGNAEIAVTTGGLGENDHTLDIAFKVAACDLTPADLTLSGLTFGPGVAPMQEIVTTNSGGNLLPESNVAGFYDAASSEGPLYTFCTEISQPVLPLQNPYTHEFNGTTNGFTAAVALRIAQVVQAAGFNSTTGFGAGNNTVVNFVALQLAIWNAIYDTDYSVSTGTFYSTTDNNGAVATANGWLATAQTIAAPTVVVHNLYHPTGQNLLKVGNPPATVTAAVTPPSCTGAGAPNNGAITISGFTNQRYQYSSGIAFDAGAAIPVAITAIPVGGVIVSNLPNTSQNYTVRIYDAADDNCYVDQVVTVTAVNCCTMTVTSATPTACVPATSTYSLDVVVTYSNGPGGNITVNTSNGSTVTVAATTSPQTITLTGLTADGVQDIDVTAFFVNDNACTNTATDAYDAPAACGIPPSCNCFNYVYLNDVANYDGANGFVHKFRVNADGTMTEMPNGTTGTTPWFPVGGGLPNPHGLGQDLNGNLYIGESPGGDIRRLSCDGTLYPETGPTGYLVDNGAGYNIGSTSDGILYTNPTFEDQISAYDICSGTSLGYVTLGSFPVGTRAWGMFVAPDGTVYVSATDFPFSGNSQPKYIWKFNPTQADLTAHTTYVPFIDVDAAVAAVGVTNADLQVMGLTLDKTGNIYLVAWDNTPSPDRTYIFKFNSAGALIDNAFEANDANTIGYEGSFGIIYDSQTDRLYLSGLDDCVAIVSTDLDYVGTGIPHVAGATTKGIAIARECCPSSTPITIDTILCNATLNQKFFLENLVSAGCDGPICGGAWTAGGGNTGILFDACDNSITITNTATACGTFTKTSAGGANSSCGAFSFTLKIDAATLTGPTISGNQTVCSGDIPAVLTSSGASGSSTPQYQWQSSTMSCSAGFTNIVGAVTATYAPAALGATTYYRLITSVEGNCGMGAYCRDTSNCVTLTLDPGCASCSMTVTSATPTACVPATGTYSLDVVVTYSNGPGGNITVNTSNGSTVTVAATTSPQTITLSGLTADGVQDIDVTAFFVNDNACTNTAIDAYDAPAACLCTNPVLSVSNPTICAGSVVDLTTLVTGNTPAGVLSFYATQADATAAVNALVNTTVAPAATATYYVRSQATGGCFSTQAIVITVSPAPVLVVTPESICTGGSVDLNTLVTNAGGGTLTFYSTNANALAGTPTIGSTVSPAGAANYYVRSTNANGCFSVQKITISIKPVDCGIITVTGPN